MKYSNFTRRESMQQCDRKRAGKPPIESGSMLYAQVMKRAGISYATFVKRKIENNIVPIMYKGYEYYSPDQVGILITGLNLRCNKSIANFVNCNPVVSSGVEANFRPRSSFI